MTNRKYTNRKYLDALEKKVLVFDGAMGTSLQNQNLTAEDFGGEQYNGCNDYLVISRPEAVAEMRFLPLRARCARGYGNRSLPSIAASAQVREHCARRI